MADKDEPATNGDEQEVEQEQSVEQPAADPKEEIDEDAIAAITEGVTGAVTDNDDISQEEVAEPEPEAPEPEPESEPEPKPAAEPDESVPEPAPVAADPGDFQPGDYSFEVETTDGKTVKISTPEDAESFASRLDNEEGLINASQFLNFNRKTAAMDIGIAADKKAYDAAQVVYKEAAAEEQVRTDSLAQWGRELEYLRGQDELPPLKPELNSADWTDAEVAKDPGVAATVELLSWMDSENNRRIDAGLSPITSVLDAHAAMQLQAIKSAAKASDDKDRSTRQRKGAMVGSGAATEEPLVRQGRDITGSGGTLDDLVGEYAA